jgi:hypothetical protein
MLIVRCFSVALRDYSSLLQNLSLRLFLLVLGPVGFIYAMVYLRIFFWVLLALAYTVAYLSVSWHYRKTVPRRRSKWWEPIRDHWKKR